MAEEDFTNTSVMKRRADFEIREPHGVPEHPFSVDLGPFLRTRMPARIDCISPINYDGFKKEMANNENRMFVTRHLRYAWNYAEYLKSQVVEGTLDYKSLGEMRESRIYTIQERMGDMTLKSLTMAPLSQELCSGSNDEIASFESEEDSNITDLAVQYAVLQKAAYLPDYEETFGRLRGGTQVTSEMVTNTLGTIQADIDDMLGFPQGIPSHVD